MAKPALADDLPAGIAEARKLGSKSGSSSGASPNETDEAELEVETIDATAAHPIWAIGKGWTDAGKLEIGDRLLAKGEGKELIVIRIGLVKKQAQVYNFTVDKLHTYFVGDKQQWLVHNTCVSDRWNGTGWQPAVGSQNAYSVAYETQLPISAYPDRSRGHHFQEANKILVREMDASPAFAQQMEYLIPGLRNHIVGPKGGISRESPTKLGWTWHHHTNNGRMQLVPVIQHTNAGHLQDLFHPNGEGGFAIWG